MDDSIPRAIVALKNELMHLNGKASMLREVIPLAQSKMLPVDDGTLALLHRFAANNSIYFHSHDAEISGVKCRVYEGDINSYWLDSKKHDTSYQPFYPTWILSAYALALGARSLGFEHVVDIGSGDGRIAYCARLAGAESHGIEVDEELVRLQQAISSATGVKYDAIMSDATRFDYSQLKLSKPMFFISGLPEMGEMLANSVISKVMSIGGLRSCGFNFMGSHVMKPHTRDKTKWGWGEVISRFGLEVAGVFTLPTLWTADQAIDTAYVYTKRC